VNRSRALPLPLRVEFVLAGALLIALVAATAWALVVVDRSLEAGVSALVPADGGTQPSPQEVIARLDRERQAARVALWLGAGAVGLLVFGIGLIGLRSALHAPLRTLLRDLPPDADLTGDEFQRLRAALDHYRRTLDQQRQEAQAGLHAARALQLEGTAARAQLADSDRLASVGRVAMGVAHEVGGPVAIASGYAEQLRTLEETDAPLADRLRCLDRIDEAVQRIAVILADLSQPGLVRAREADRPCDLLAVALRVEELALRHPRAKTVHLDLTAADPQHPADASASHVEQVLMNLVLNAADATQRSGRVHLLLQRDGAFQVLHVDDDGPGVDPADGEAIFEPFFSTKQAARAPGQPGWGLGLAVSRRVVEAYGGTLTVARAPELHGARFTVRLPLPAALRKG
jgi:signal transduction histidine kinase